MNRLEVAQSGEKRGKRRKKRGAKHGEKRAAKDKKSADKGPAKKSASRLPGSPPPSTLVCSRRYLLSLSLFVTS
ncbi:hypothetical protein [Paraburkholderia xenovorans]